ncbi:deoxyribose-phosphate aldolase [Moniliophthora roreri]|uniref:deoxyribose-phosphate aldolase n=1 Tax=Moniliophthora roreri TaxID=221103 RepID=A0A0W0FVJ6_MONRR|nr:deoxyribose-phosphate aldolase [Moniliophthora roreri]
MSRSNEEWAVLIAQKASEVLADNSECDSSLTTITAPDDQFALAIDHTLLKPDSTPAQIDQLCDEAIKYKFKARSCCVNGANVKQVAERLQGSSSIPCAVIGFPLGACTTAAKGFETRDAITSGAQEIDMVIPIGTLKAKDYKTVFTDISFVVQAASPVPVKVILETVFLTDEEKIAASFIAAEAGTAFVKTCTGFLGGGATIEDVKLMWRTVRYKEGKVKVKASGGVRTFEKCLAMFKAGAERIGTSSGAAIIADTSTKGGY